MKKFLKKIKNKISSSRRKIISKMKYTITFKNGNVEFLFEDSIFNNDFVVVSNSTTNRQKKVKITKSSAVFNIRELYKLSNDSKENAYNIYLLKPFWIKNLVNPLPYINHMQNLSNYENKIKISTAKTKKNKVFFNILKTNYDILLEKLQLEFNYLIIEGRIKKYTNEKTNQIFIEIIKRSNPNIRKIVNVDFEDDGDIIKFFAKANLGLLLMSSELNERWDFKLNITNNQDMLVYSNLLDATQYADFITEESRYLNKCQLNETFFAVIYVTMGKNSLSVWLTDEQQYETTYNLSIGKTIYKNLIDTTVVHDKLCFFESFLGKNYSGNPKYLYEAMLKDERFNDFQFVWTYNDDDRQIIPGNPVLVQRGSKEYFEYLGRAKYIINNILFPINQKREETIYLQTWHGTPLKKLAFDITINGPEVLGRENFYIESRLWDFLISANDYSSNIFRRAFKFEKEILEYGYPANTIFYDNEKYDLIQNKTKAHLGLPKEKKLILYAPTWRDNVTSSSWNFGFELPFDVKEVYQALSEEYVILLRLHHLISDSFEIEEQYKDFLVNCSNYDDIQELYTISDICITDYSSVFFDFAHTKKPLLFYAADYKEYAMDIRGFYLSVEQDLPGPLLIDTFELIQAVKNINNINELYKEKYEWFIKKFCNTGYEKESSNKIIERMLEEGAIRNGK